MTNLLSFQYDEHWASAYDRRIRIVIPGYDLVHDLVASTLQVKVPHAERILVVGAGTGTELERLSTYNSEWHLVGIDISPAMLSIASERLQDQCLHGRVTLRECSIEDINPNERYAAATMILVMQLHADDGAKLELLRSVARHLESGSPFVLVDTFGITGSNQFKNNADTLRILTTRAGFTPQEAEEDILSLQRFHFISEERIFSLLTEAGFAFEHRIFQSLFTGGWLARRI